MLKKFHSKSGQSLVEYASLVIFIIAAFWFFQKYIARGISGRWKQAGDSMGLEKVYDNSTVRCINDVFTDRPDVWFRESCIRDSTVGYEYCIKNRDTVLWDQTRCRNHIDGCISTPAGSCPF